MRSAALNQYAPGLSRVRTFGQYRLRIVMIVSWITSSASASGNPHPKTRKPCSVSRCSE